jgi:hypothetical protein
MQSRRKPVLNGWPGHLGNDYVSPMKRTSEHSPILEFNLAGHLTQIGTTSAFTSVASSPYSGIKSRALSLVDLFNSHGLDMRKSASLQRLIDMTIAMSDSWDSGAKDEVTFAHLLAAVQIDRITSAALSTTRCVAQDSTLRGLLTGSLDLLGREQSKAKDTLWELELLRILVDHKIDVTLGEPDLSVHFSGAPEGFACKKIYSERNVSKVLSNAVSQIEREGEFGIIALNLDDLFPVNAILKAPTLAVMSSILEDRINAFLRTHERHLRKYLTPGRAISALVSCAAIADVENRLLNARQTTVWQIPGIPDAKAEQMNQFLAAMNAQYVAT